MYYMCTCNITNNTFTYNNGFVTEFTKNINMYTQIKSKRISIKILYLNLFVGRGEEVGVDVKIFLGRSITRNLRSLQKKILCLDKRQVSFHKICTFKIKMTFFSRYNSYSIVFKVNRVSSINAPNTNFSLI